VPKREWQEGFALSGRGSTTHRAQVIENDIFSRYVPVPSATPSPDRNDFLHAIIGSVEQSAAEVGVRLI
jgi:hypothetical protein